MNRRAVWVLLVVPLVLTGCASDDGKKPAVLPSLAPPSLAPSVAPVPSVPAEASAETAQGASAFVRYFLSEINEAFRLGDATRVRRLSDQGCVSCARLVAAIERPSTPGERIDGGDYVVAGVATTLDKPGTATALVDYGQSAVRVLDASGTIVQERPATPPAPATIELKMQGASGWIVTAFTDIDQ